MSTMLEIDLRSWTEKEICQLAELFKCD